MHLLTPLRKVAMSGRSSLFKWKIYEIPLHSMGRIRLGEEWIFHSFFYFVNQLLRIASILLATSEKRVVFYRVGINCQAAGYALQDWIHRSTFGRMRTSFNRSQLDVNST